MTATILRASAYRRTPWKNGGGETREVAISPAGASLERFDWRISIATVSSDGPFSLFTGVDRTLCMLEGGIALRIDGEPVRELNDASEPFSFPGELPAHATLIGRIAIDFNVMTRREGFAHAVRRVRVPAGHVREVSADVRAAFCQSGCVSLETAGGVRDRLDPFDTIIRHAPDGDAWALSADSDAVLCLVTISERR